MFTPTGQAVEFGVRIGEYRGVVRFPRIRIYGSARIRRVCATHTSILPYQDITPSARA
jgi:hypothetical protein